MKKKSTPIDMTPSAILHDPLVNKGTGFTQEERDELGLTGFLPHHVSTIEEQVRRRYQNFLDAESRIDKYKMLTALQDRNEVLFYRLVSEHAEEMLPYIYTPTVGDASLEYTYMYNQNRGVYLSYPMRDRLDTILKTAATREIKAIVITDGSRILGYGDLGVGGMAIPVGKLSLYTVFGGIHPEHTLPIFIDVGTNNPKLLNDPLYLGWRHERVEGEAYDNFIDAIVKGIKKAFPKALLQWEDFAKLNARRLLDKYKTTICSFNDDIQGTAAVTVSAIHSAVQLAGEELKDQKIAILGGGSAGMGIAEYFKLELMQEGLSEKEACKQIYVVDRLGLIHTGKKLRAEQKPFAHDEKELLKWKIEDIDAINLMETILHARPSILVGVSGQPDQFSKEMIQEMASYAKHPIVFPLSNPTSRVEAKPEDIIQWTKGTAIVAAGSPFETVTYKGKKHPIPQCNNVYIFPGVGLGVIASQSTQVTDAMFLVAARVLSGFTKEAIFPPLSDLTKASRAIAIAVGKEAVTSGLSSMKESEIEAAVDAEMWTPKYATFKKS